jgi:hypothetical protein
MICRVYISVRVRVNEFVFIIITDNTTNLKKIFNINRDKPVLPKNVSLIEVFERGLEALNIQ